VAVQQPPHFPGKAVDPYAILGHQSDPHRSRAFDLRSGVWNETAVVMKLSNPSSREIVNSSPGPVNPDSVPAGCRPTGSASLGHEWADSFRADMRACIVTAARVSNVSRQFLPIRKSGSRPGLLLGRSDIDIPAEV
jgi:hypothetical protein